MEPIEHIDVVLAKIAELKGAPLPAKWRRLKVTTGPVLGTLKFPAVSPVSEKVVSQFENVAT